MNRCQAMIFKHDRPQQCTRPAQWWGGMWCWQHRMGDAMKYSGAVKEMEPAKEAKSDGC